MLERKSWGSEGIQMDPREFLSPLEAAEYLSTLEPPPSTPSAPVSDISTFDVRRSTMECVDHHSQAMAERAHSPYRLHQGSGSMELDARPTSFTDFPEALVRNTQTDDSWTHPSMDVNPVTPKSFPKQSHAKRLPPAPKPRSHGPAGTRVAGKMSATLNHRVWKSAADVERDIPPEVILLPRKEFNLYEKAVGLRAGRTKAERGVLTETRRLLMSRERARENRYIKRMAALA